MRKLEVASKTGCCLLFCQFNTSARKLSQSNYMYLTIMMKVNTSGRTKFSRMIEKTMYSPLKGPVATSSVIIGDPNRLYDIFVH